ncbi:unnamed protein product [Parascedosporium putredinis]|uniref:AMP-dependent synthetase/ligase domain-containing protein n=1 Tax=Parascedosporium putredinis TaxID=1442378 RepID=A0A9P1MA75_9PEZI|nr:unnamed protein product [Parascedosporium putredinis]CAI7996949.1 unnamed protein product [Parascedosporium putredinis]
MTHMQVNIALLTPTGTRLLRPEDVPSLRTLVFGGEAVTAEDQKRWNGLPEIINAYGPTEGAVCCAAASMKGSREPAKIGTTIASVGWVVNRRNHNHLVPLGAVGELLIEGPNLARDYIDDPVKTAAAFIEKPSWFVQGAQAHNKAARLGRLYKTGDLVRLDYDSSLTYIGRKDMQVKINGERVELGEIEHHLQHLIPGASHVAAKVIRPDGGKSPQTLVAFFEAKQSTRVVQEEPAYVTIESNMLLPMVAGLDVRVVRVSQGVSDALARRLPMYMVPSLFLRVTKMPRTLSDKMDDCGFSLHSSWRLLGSSGLW